VTRLRSPIILDHGPLLTYLCWLFLDSIDATANQRRDAVRALDLKDLNWDADQHLRLHNILTSQACVTTTLVLHEILQLREYSYLANDKERFRRFGLAELPKFAEICVPLRDIDEQDKVVHFGLTDAGLLQIAQQRGGTLLTIDTKLYAAWDSEARFDIMLLKDAIKN
jgi:predicted nucleic acid-binding protein